MPIDREAMIERAKAYEIAYRFGDRPAKKWWGYELLADFAASEIEAATAGLAAENAALRAALCHYADESFWDEPHPDLGSATYSLYNFEDEIQGQIDGYVVAQEALAAESQATAPAEAGEREGE